MEKLRITYTHDCGCKYQGVVLDDYPVCRAGAALIVRPVCVETGVELKIVESRN